jgi:hypothetical protein
MVASKTKATLDWSFALLLVCGGRVLDLGDELLQAGDFGRLGLLRGLWIWTFSLSTWVGTRRSLWVWDSVGKEVALSRSLMGPRSSRCRHERMVSILDTLINSTRSELS